MIRCIELEKQAINLSEKGGYRVLVPDLYKGKVGVDKEEAHHVRFQSAPRSILSHCTFLMNVERGTSHAGASQQDICSEVHVVWAAELTVRLCS
jgi:hypothetical protein